jgi:hypothetical protein
MALPRFHRRKRDTHDEVAEKLFGKSFDECGICLDTMYTLVIGNTCVGINVRKLPCGHLFHSKCLDVSSIRDKAAPICPICQRQLYTFNSSEKRLFTRKRELSKDDIEYIKSMKHDRAMALVKEALTIDNVLLPRAVASHFDVTELLHSLIVEKNAKAISRLIRTKRVNWHRTFRGKTLREAAADSHDSEIIQLLSSAAV